MSMKILILLNAKAGTLNTGAVQDPHEIVARAFADAGHAAEVVLVEPDEMNEKLEAAAGTARFRTRWPRSRSPARCSAFCRSAR
jgi:hypothetical protein